MGTRISLVQATREQEKRRQIANILTPLSKTLLEVERQCLIRISQAARSSGQKQMALNAVFQAQGLSKESHFDVLQEFAYVLWQQGEQKQAIQVLSDLRASDTSHDQAELAMLDAGLVSHIVISHKKSEAQMFHREPGHLRLASRKRQ